MSNNKQSSIEWLKSIVKDMIANGGDADLHAVLSHIEQAKAMEKEQMIGLLQWMNRVTQSNPMRLETDDDDVVEQYYLETYGGNK